MSAEHENQSLLVRVFDNFLQERNIKWLLALGMLILLASSVMLVTSQWDQEQYTPFWKYLTLLAYAGAIFAAGQWSYFRAGLRKTGTGLMALTVLLTPLTFLALRWVQSDRAAGLWTQSSNWALLAVNCALGWAAAHRVFTHFLRGRQPTLTASFLILSLAGAVLPGVDWAARPAAAPLAALALWGVFAVGTVKVQRRVFWLAEERRAPRVFGFFPILLLGGQYLLLFAFNFAQHMQLQWIGLGCVLTAVPVLLTADAVAHVFQQRTGDLVRPLPWSIALPLLAGLGLAAAGVCLAGAGLRPPRDIPLPLAPSAALAALLAAVAAHRTGHRALVWAMLLLLTLAYNFSYAFFRDAATLLIQHGAAAVNESRLPLAFYGLTYLPLLSGLTVAAARCRRRGNLLFAVPLQTFTLGLSTLLLVVACTHVKALLPVGAALTALLAAQAKLFDDRRAVAPLLAAALIAVVGLVPFVERVLGLTLPEYAHLTSIVLAAWALPWIGGRLDRRAARLSLPQSWRRVDESVVGQAPCQVAGLALALLLGMIWLSFYSWNFSSNQQWPAALLIAGLLVFHALRWARVELAAYAYIFTAAAAVSFALAWGASISAILSGAVAVLLGQWMLAYLLEQLPEGRAERRAEKGGERRAEGGEPSRAGAEVSSRQRFRPALRSPLSALGSCTVFAPVLRIGSLAGLILALLGICVPRAVLEIAQLPSAFDSFAFPWTLRLLLVVWAVDAARRFALAPLAGAGYLTLLGLLGAALIALGGTEAYPWLPAAWTVAALACLPAAELLRRHMARLPEGPSQKRAKLTALAAPLDYLLWGVFAAAAFATLPLLGWPIRLAGCGGVAGLLILAKSFVGEREASAPWPKSRDHSQWRVAALAALNWQALAVLIALSFPAAHNIFETDILDNATAGLMLAVAAAASVPLWQWRSRALPGTESEIAAAQPTLLRIAAAGGLAASWTAAALTPLDAPLAGAAFLALAASELGAACRRGQVERVWTGEAVLGGMVLYFLAFGVIVPGRGLSLFAVLAAGLLATAASRWAAPRPQTAVLARPFEQIGLLLPLGAVALGIVGHWLYEPQWLGANSLALLLAAGFYCWQAIEQGRTRFWLIAAGILNVALLLLWRELKLSDPQFYLVPIGGSILALTQLLKREIPRQALDPLRYLGAIVILVSPTFHIVGGSWPHSITLLVASVGVVLLAIALRVRALMYVGTGFLTADLVAMVVRGSLAHPNLLWIVGLGVGAFVVALAAICENRREQLQQRLRIVSAALRRWE